MEYQDDAPIGLLWAKIAYFFPLEVDVFEDRMAMRLGLLRPRNISHAQWRELRQTWISERELEADELVDDVAAYTSRLCADRARLETNAAGGAGLEFPDF